MTEAQRLGRRAIAIDINPIALQIIAAKALNRSAHDIRQITDEIIADVASLLGDDLVSHNETDSVQKHPPTVQLAKWYSESVGADLCRLWDYCGSQTGDRRVICDASFSSILKRACRETRHWGYVCDNVQPKDDVVGRNLSVLALLDACLKKLSKGYDEREKALQTSAQLSGITCISESALSALVTVEAATASLVLTSPPYFGVHDYAKSQRLSMEWIARDIAQVRDQEIGARSKRSRRSGAEDYLREMTDVFRAAYRALKPGGWLAVIVGESVSRISVVPQLLQSTKSLGFSLEFERTRQIGNDRAQAPVLKSERVLVWRK